MLITHDLARVVQMSDEVAAIMCAGRFAESGRHLYVQNPCFSREPPVEVSLPRHLVSSHRSGFARRRYERGSSES